MELTKISIPEISMPKGGGAIKGMGDSFQPNFFSGTSSYSIPIPVTEGRGFDPKLTLDYNSGAGNSEFGLGFSLSLSKIAVRADKRIPKYDGTDVYTFSATGVLVKKHNNKLRHEQLDNESFEIITYLPRIEGVFSKIEHWYCETMEFSFWKVVSKDNITSFYGRNEHTRIANPTDPSQIFEWLLDESCDAKGNKIVYVYKTENNENIPPAIYEENRVFGANRYISMVKYGNFIDQLNKEQFAFETIFDYGEYDLSDLQKAYLPVKPWDCRPDPFSSYKSGFEIRTFRLCKHVLLFHNFEKELGSPCLVKSLRLDYVNLQDYKPVEVIGLSLVYKLIVTGYRKVDNDNFIQKELPPLVLNYSSFSPPGSPTFKTLSIDEATIPGYLSGAQFQQVDLYGDGIPGFLYNNNESVLYMSPEGDGKYGMPENCKSFPVNNDFQKGEVSLADIDGNGQLELVVNKAGNSGYYQNEADGSWGNFQSFPRYPNISNPAIEIADLDADGKNDLLLASTEDILIYFSEGKKGYEPGKRIPNSNGFPLRKQDYLQELVTFANIFGDGLNHRVKITNGAVECWPCLGYGRFGKKITLANAPYLGCEFDSRRVFLTDIDGSGTADLIYVYPDRVAVFLNQGGNSFSKAINVYLPAIYTDVDRISFSDILGNGTTCLVFTKITPVPIHYYYNFVGEVTLQDGTTVKSMKPYLLNEIDNNMGTITQVQYCSSTKFALEDKQAGHPWVTKLRFPVQVVEQTTIIDRISGSRFVNKFKYHDGYYDPLNRDFCGFGYVESWDSETFPEYEQSKQDPGFPVERLNAELYVPPSYTRSWFHTGAYMASPVISRQYHKEYFNGDTGAYDFPDSIFETDIYQDNDTLKQAYGSLKGQSLRKEVYANDKSAVAGNPYTVEESNFEVKLIQAAENQYAVFQVNPRERIVYHYERNPQDPRVQQEFTLDVDPLCGQVKTSCTVFLPRRAGTGGAVYPEQQKPECTVKTNNYINSTSEDPFWYRGVQYQNQELEINGLSLKGSVYATFHDINEQVNKALETVIPYGEDFKADILQARQLIWNRNYFWNEEQSTRLALGQISSRGLVYNKSEATFTKSFISKAFENRLSDAVIENEGGYFFDIDTGYWWNQGLVQHYFLPAQPECFFMTSKIENSFVSSASALFQKTVLDYNAPYYILPISTKSYLQEEVFNTQIFALDYQAHKYKQVVDINGNVNQVLFDPFGQLIVSSIFGKEDGLDKGGMCIYPYQSKAANYVNRLTTPLGGPVTFNDVLANNEYYLQGAASYFFYDFFAYSDSKQFESVQPSSAITLLRVNYYDLPEGISPFSCQAFIEFSDGVGRSVEKKQRTEKGVAILRNTEGSLIRDLDNKPVQAQSDERWLVSGRTVYNNKNKTCQEYLPYFTNIPGYENQQDIVNEKLVPPPAVIHFDPLIRVIRIDTPKGFFSKVEFTPWEEKHYDEDDTVIDSAFYQEYYPDKITPDEKDAIDKAKVFFNTPTIKKTSNTGHVFLEIQTLPEGRQLMTYSKSDRQGRTLKAIDPRLYNSNLTKGTDYYNFKYLYGMGSDTPLYTESADAGKQKAIHNVFGNLFWSWSARDYCELISYDKLQRRLSAKVKKIEKDGPITSFDDFNLVELLSYGEQEPDTGRNLRGELYQLKDLSGMVLNSSYSLKKELLRKGQQIVRNYKEAINWNKPVELEEEVYISIYNYDALEHLLFETTPDNSITANSYNLAGLLCKTGVTYSDGSKLDLINTIDYDAKQQRVKIGYSNGISSFYTYESTTLRLVKLCSKKNDGAGKELTVQNITYTYDPFGNLTRLWDYTFETIFNNNQKVDPLSEYTYDAVYRLIKSNGRQHPGINANTYKNNQKDKDFKQSIFSQLPSINDQDKLENYSELYTYDDSGNLIKKQHIATSSSFTVDTPVQDNSNRQLNVTCDAAGNQLYLQLNNNVPLSYNSSNNLVGAGIIERPEEPDDYDYYVYNSGQVRTRKISERMLNGGSSTEITEKIYLGNYEIKRIRIANVHGEMNTILERQTLRVMDNKTCMAILHYWIKDERKREADAAGTRSERFQMGNNLGSVSLEMDKNAMLISYEEYFSYGGTAIIAGQNQQEVALKEYRYSGKECDNTTGLYYYGARYYISWLGRWNKPDPAGTSDGLNLYSFVKNNPVKFIDQTGNISLVAAKVAIGVASLFLFIGGPIAGAVGGAIDGYRAFDNPVAKVAGAIGGAIGGAIVGGVLGTLNTVLTPFRWIYDIALHNYRKYAPERQLAANPATQYPAVLYNPTQHTPILGVQTDSGRSGAELIAEQRGIPRSLWGTHVRAFDDNNLGTLTGNANFNNQLIMVGHGSPNGWLEAVGNHAIGQEWLEGQDGGGQGVREVLEGRGLNWGNVNSIDMCICTGSVLADNMSGSLNAQGHDITTRASNVGVSPIGNLHEMGVIRGGSSISGEIFHWLSGGMFKSVNIESSPVAAGRMTNQQNGAWNTIRS